MTFQKTIIVGNLGGDPESRFSPSGQMVTNFSVATNRKYKGADGNTVDETIWFRASAWGKQAETCNQYLKRGSKVLIEGRLTADPATGGPRIWNKNDGTPATSFEITAQSVQFLSTRGEDRQGVKNEAAGPDIGDGDNVPF